MVRSGRRAPLTFAFTPKHGSCLDLVECFFSKMARSMLRHIRVASKDELKRSLMAHLDDLNHDLVIHTCLDLPDQRGCGTGVKLWKRCTRSRVASTAFCYVTLFKPPMRLRQSSINGEPQVWSRLPNQPIT